MTLYINGKAIPERRDDDVEDKYGSGNDAYLGWETSGTDGVGGDAHYLNLAVTGASRNLIISEDRNIDWEHATQTDPTLWIQSADSSDTSDYIALSHNQTNAVIDVGNGGLDVSGASQVFAADGLVGTPAYAFGSDTDTGFYSAASGLTQYASNGVLKLRFDASGIGTISGSAAAPSYYFNSDLDTGMYLEGTGVIGFSSGGAIKGEVTGTGFALISGAAATPSLNFISDPDTGIFLSTANVISFSAAGVERFLISSTGSQTTAGSAASPGYSFIGDSDTGIWNTTNQINFGTAGTERMSIGRTGDVIRHRAEFIDEFWNGVQSQWATRTTTGSVAAQGTSNGVYRLTTGAVDDNEESIDWNDICTFQSTLRPSFHCRIKLDQASDIQVRVGLTESVGVGVDDFICLRVNSDTDTNWYLVASDGGAETTDVGPAAGTSMVDFKWEFTSDTTLEWFYSTDGGLTWASQGTVTSNVPTEQLQPFAEVIVRNNGGVRYIELDTIKVFQDRI